MIQQLSQRAKGVRAGAGISLISAPVQVPAGYVGMHLHRWPANPTGGAADPAPTYSFGTYRTHDGGCTWRKAHTANGVFDWSYYDQVINYYSSIGCEIIYTLFSTPTWAAKPAMQGTAGPYGGLGECAPPSDHAYAGAFITALLQRYNGGAVKKIQYIEIWNEPNFLENLSGFYWGSAIDLVKTGVAVRDAAAAVDPSVKILSPGFTGSSAVLPWLSAVDPVSGNKGFDLIYGVGIHPYAATAYGHNSFIGAVNQAKNSMMTAGGSLKPVLVTEYGVDPSPGNIGWFLALPQHIRKSHIARLLVMGALAEIKVWALYSHNSTLVGDLYTDTGGVIAAITEVHNAIAGKTISSAYLLQTGVVSISADGITHAF